ncbi:hypothetical protein [Tenacibaculum sp. 190524A05c]|uniref:hypothetical protein n=1 Tax=Tenacibaculum platacis TaxID=3137852 RepID=UPI0032B17961
MNKENKYLKLLLGIVFDLIGYVSFIIPWFAEITDVIWAPVSAYLMTRMYKGKKGKVAAVVSFVEEALPWLDIIPTFTLMWIYTYVISSENNDVKKTIEV